jgi:hypothetical protein
MITESGVTGADRIKSREDFQQFINSYTDLISQFPGFVNLRPSGSFNSDLKKVDFGDIDLIIHINSKKNKSQIKKDMQAFFTAMPETVIVPFSSSKHKGKRTYNAGELISVRYHDPQLGYSVQIDNIIALGKYEADFKQRFLDYPAEEQGLILGLVKIATIETDPKLLFKRLGIPNYQSLPNDHEYEFTVSSVDVQLREVTYSPGTLKEINRVVIWQSKNFQDVRKLLYQYDLDSGFDSLLTQAKQTIRNPRSKFRLIGIFSSMITVKSGEVGTPKGENKIIALTKLKKAFESHSIIFTTLVLQENIVA